MLRLVHECVAVRIRFRALLTLLETGEPFDFGKFKAIYREYTDRDANAMFSQIVLTDAEYSRLFGEWEQRDSAQYTAGWPVRTPEEPAALEPQDKTKRPALSKPKKPRP
jgi:hypothetical protein